MQFVLLQTDEVHQSKFIHSKQTVVGFSYCPVGVAPKENQTSQREAPFLCPSECRVSSLVRMLVWNLTTTFERLVTHLFQMTEIIISFF